MADGDALDGEPVDGIPYTDAQGYSRLRTTERAWVELRRAGVIAGVTFVTPVLLWTPVTDVVEGRLVEPAKELGERSVAGRAQPADACEGSSTREAGAHGGGVPLTHADATWGVCPDCGGRHDGDCREG